MKIVRIEISNFRLLSNFSLDLESELSVIIGKNNTGKTSILTCLDKFVNQSDLKAITFEDFNIELRSSLERILLDEKIILSESEYIPLGVQLKLHVKYDMSDDLSQISRLIMSLDPTDDNIILSFEYKISFKNLHEMKTAYITDANKFDNKPGLFLKENLNKYFSPITKKSLLFKDKSQFIDIKKEKINLQDILAIQFISAKRSVTNKQNDKTLSNQTSNLYKQADESKEQENASDGFKQELRKTDTKLSEIYQQMFDGVIKKVSEFGGISQHDTKIKISSTLQHRELLEGNATVMYAHENHDLPEHYNGLGYMNLISMIFDIEILMNSLRCSIKEKPAAINLLFIEEPEAHTHPQMQYVFIKNIKKLLRENKKRKDGVEINLQSVITTHSAHIVAESSFDDIKYLRKSTQSCQVQAKNLKDLERLYSSNDDSKLDTELKQAYKFLKQYLTLNRAELFFADKAIFIEGDTERIILPAMMKKLDQEIPSANDQPLLSQNISIVEVGAHSQIFEKFIDFIGIKSLIITDIDSYYEKPVFEEDGITPSIHKNGSEKKEEVKCRPNDPLASKTSNASLKFFFERDDLSFYIALTSINKILQKTHNQNKWIQAQDGQIMIVYQIEEKGSHARSYEDAFFSINKSILNKGHAAFPSLTKKHLDKFINDKYNAYEFSDKAVNSKPSLAIEILMNSETSDEGKEYSNWTVPAYIKEGLLWLRQN